MADLFFWGTGRRKSATARVRICKGEGKIIINKRPSLISGRIRFNSSLLVIAVFVFLIKNESNQPKRKQERIFCEKVGTAEPFVSDADFISIFLFIPFPINRGELIVVIVTWYLKSSAA